MVLSVACVSAANAAFISIDSCGIDDGISPVPPTASGGYNYSSGSGMRDNYETSQPYGAATSRDLIGNYKSATVGGYSKGSISVGTSAMTMSYGGAATTNASKWWNQESFVADSVSGVKYSSQTSIAVWGAFGTDPAVAFAGAIDMSAFTAFSFDLSGFTTSGSNNIGKMYLNVLDNYGALGSYEVALSNGHVDVAASNFGALDWSSIYQIEMVFTNSQIVSGGSIQAVATGTVNVSNFGYVPAPGAAALIGLAGLVSSRRRRN